MHFFLAGECMGLTLLHAFCRLLLFVFAMFCFFFKKLAFSKKNILGKQLKCQTVWTKIRLPVSSILVSDQTVYKIVYVEWASRVNFVTIFGDLYQNKLWVICNNLNQFAHLSSASGPSSDVIKMAAIVLLMYTYKTSNLKQ